MRVHQTPPHIGDFLVCLLLACGACSDTDLRQANERAAIALEDGRPAEAVSILKSIGSQIPQSPNVLVNLGRAYLELGEVDKGLVELGRAGTLVGNDDPILLLLARIFLSCGEVGEADRMLERCGPSLQGKAEYHLILGHLLFDVGSDREGITAEFREALRLDPANREAAESLLVLMQGMTDPAAVKMTLASLPDQAVRSGRARLLIGEILAGLGRWKEAMEIARGAVNSQADNVGAWVLLARSQAALGQTRGAEFSFREALHRSSNAPNVTIEYARFLVEQGRDSESLLLLAAAEESQVRLPLADRLPALHNLLAAIYARRGELLLARQQLGSSLAIDPDQPKTRSLLGKIGEMHKTTRATGGQPREEPVETDPPAP